MAKKIAVLVRDRQDEALRMAVGLILADDTVEVYVLDRKVEESEANNLNIETMKDMDMTLRTNCRENEGIEFMSTEEIAARLPEYDNVIAY